MLTAETSDGTKVAAFDVDKHDGPFACTGCGDPVVLKAGPRVSDHFAHKPGASCSVSDGESEEHTAVKTAVFRSLLDTPLASNVAMERNLGTVRPDISGRIRGHRVAVEVQRSNLSEELIAYRTACYAEKGIAVIWLLTETFDDAWDDTIPGLRRFSPRPWQLWLHAATFGRLYSWGTHTQRVRSVHLAEFTLYREGREGFSSGIVYPSKRWRTPVFGPTTSLVEDFKPVERRAWSGGKIVIPPCTLWADTLAPWWKDSRR